MSLNPFKKFFLIDYIILIRILLFQTLILENELTDNIVGNELGQWRLEAVIEKGIFIRPKLYSYLTDEGILKKVASSVDSNQLNYADF